MKKSEYNAVKRQLQSRHDETVAEADARLAAAMQALDDLWAAAGEGEVPTGPGRRKSTTRKTTRKKVVRKKRRGRPAKATTARKRTTKKVGKKRTTKRGRTRRARGSFIESMRSAISPLSGQFTVAEVKDGLKQQGVSLASVNPAVLSTTMKRLEDLGELKLVERGRGRRASIYKKKG